MAEALCGPSNALQQFKQSTQHDRTLQQDRLVSRHRPAQGFRSHDPNVVHMDAEFEAFQAGVPLADFHQQHFVPLSGQQHFQESLQQAPSWASDFSQMSLGAAPALQSRIRPMPDAANWAQELMLHSKPMQPKARQVAAASPQAFQQNARYGPPGFRSTFAQPAFSPMVQGKGKAAVTEDFDEAAFERAFDLARDDMMTDVEATLDLQEDSAQGDAMVSDTMQQNRAVTEQDSFLDKMLDPGHLDVDVDALHEIHDLELSEDLQDIEKQNHVEEGKDDDALAATAQDLLEKVENNKSDKFQNSQFLGLMRKLRDREVKVRGDKMVESEFESISATNSPLTSFSYNTRFDNTEQTPALLDSRPPQYEYDMPLEGQDADLGAFNPADGQDVAALLAEPGLPGGEPDPTPIGVGEDLDDEFRMTSPYYQP